MSDVTQLPAYVQLRYQENGVISRMEGDIRRVTDNAKRQFTDAFQEVGRQIDRSLSVERNAAGALDLQADKLREVASAAQARAIAAEEVARATRMAAQAEGDYSQKARNVIAATEAMAREERDAAAAALARAEAAEQVQIQLNKQASATQEVINATSLGTVANRQLVNSTQAVRQASVQAGQQLQDIGIMLYSGQQAAVTFAQQLPQLAFALSGLEGQTNKTLDKVGKFATFLAGPWGLAVGVAVGVLGTYIASLLQSEEAADDSSAAQQSLADQLDITKNSWTEITKAVDEYNNKQRIANETTLQAAEAAQIQAKQNYETAISWRTRLQETLKVYQAEVALGPTGPNGQGQIGASAGASAIASMLASLDADIKQLETARDNTTFDLASARAEIATDGSAAIKEQFAERRQEVKALGLDVEELTRRLSDLNRQEKAALDTLRETNKARSGSTTAELGRQASLGEMTALIKQLFPGATVTSGLRPGDKGSDHSVGRAIDFVPSGGMGMYTTAEVEQILSDAGVTIRRSGTGKKQIFGPGRPAKNPGDHDDHFHVAWTGSVNADRVADAREKAAEQAAKRLQQIMERSGETVARISERFDEQPRLIDQANAAQRRLNDTIVDMQAELAKLEADDPRRAGIEQVISEAQAAKGVVEDALVRPFEHLREESERRLEIESLLAAGMVDEAAALQEITRLEQVIGDLNDQQKEDVLDTVRAERQRSLELERQRALLDAQLDVLDTARNGLQDILSGRSTDLLGDLKQSLMDLRGARLFDDLFGDVFADLQEELGRNTPLGRANSALAKEVDTSATHVLDFGQAVQRATQMVAAATAANDNGPYGAVAPGSSFEQAFAAIAGSGGVEGVGEPIVVKAGGDTEIGRRSSAEIADKIAAGIVNPLLEGMGDLFGTGFTQALGGVLSGVLAGYIRGGKPGAVLGGAKGLLDSVKGDSKLLGGLSDALGGALGGAEKGTQIAGIAKALGIGFSSSGAQVGGAIGSLFPMIPGGDIIGAIAGGIIGKIIGGTKRGSATVGNVGGELGVTGVRGNSSSRKDSAGDLAGSVSEAVARIAEQLGASVDSSAGAVSIGIRDKNIRVDRSGRGITKTANGAVDFGEDAEAAIRYAVRDLITDGVIKGLSDAENRLLQAGDDIEAAIRDVLDFRSVFDRLKEYKDPVGAALDRLDKEFERLIDLFDRAGASAEEYAQLEELYGLERAKAIQEATERMTGSLKALLDDLTIGDSGLSLRTRRSNALTQYDALAARVAAGDTSAYDDFAEIARQLLDIERELYGSTQAYFDRLSEVTDLTRTRIEADTNIAELAAGRDSPFDGAGNVRDAIVDQNEWLRYLPAINDNIIALGRGALIQGSREGSGGGAAQGFVFDTPAPKAVKNF